jgi:hypothetical protein
MIGSGQFTIDRGEIGGQAFGETEKRPVDRSSLPT